MYRSATSQNSIITHLASTRLWRWNRHSASKRRLLNTIRRRTTQKVTHDNYISISRVAQSYFSSKFDYICISCNLQNVLVLKDTCFFCLQRMLVHCSATVCRSVADGLKVYIPADSFGLLHRHANPLAWQSEKLPSDTNTSTHTAEPTRVTQRH
jgi:hypothetical protein